MRRWVWVVAAAVLLLGVAAPYELRWTDWRYDPANYPKMVKWAGCQAPVVVDPDASPVASYYRIGEYMSVGTKEDAGVPYYAGLFILFHETGHCLQYQEGWIQKQDDIQTIELDADRRSADLMCGLGLDGRSLLIQTFEWVHDQFGYNGDWAHGTLADREAQAANAHQCDKVSGL